MASSPLTMAATYQHIMYHHSMDLISLPSSGRLTTILHGRILLVLLVLIQCLSLNTPHGMIRLTSAASISTLEAPFAVSAMTYVDTQGTFLISQNQLFTLTFFTQSTGDGGGDGDGAIVYLCIIHAPSQQIVWTANPDSPVSSAPALHRWQSRTCSCPRCCRWILR